MATYALYLESGPQRKSTLAHVFDPLGCVAFARTSDEAVAAMPEEIRAYLRALRRHGEKVDADAPVEVRVAEHRAERGFSPGGGFLAPDGAPVRPAELARWLRWLEWSRADLLALVEGLDRRRLEAKPAQGRSLREILLHVLGADRDYVGSVLGAHRPVNAPANAAEKGELDLRVALRESRAAAIERLRAMTPAERARIKRRPRSTTSTRRAIRRMLEHEWEHRREIARRLGREA